MLVTSCLAAEVKVDSQVSEVSKTKLLAERMESYGYYKSALHYYKLLQLETSLSVEERKVIELKIEEVNQRLEKKYAKNNLPDLDEMLHVETVSKTSLEQLSLEKPEAFPKTRIDKKKWLIGTLIVVGVGVIAYAVNQNLRKKDDQSPTTTIQVGF